ncbi:spore germination protein [Evansella sp. LMS18]|nr:spore germination protein [Evansella sp. LMS18]
MIFIIQTQIGAGFISLPFSVHTSERSSDGWITVLLIGIIIQILITLYTLLAKRFPSLTFFEITTAVFGKFIGKAISAAYILFFLLIAAHILIVYCTVIEVWVFPQTPDWVIISSMSLVALYLVKEKLQIITRYHTVICYLLFILPVLSLPAYGNVEFRYLLPVGGSGLFTILSKIPDGFLSFIGFEVMLFLYPFVKGTNKQKYLAATYSNIFFTVYTTYFSILTYIFFSPEELKLVPQPVLYILKAFTFPVFERVDILFLSTWTVLISTSLVSYAYLTALGVKQTLRLQHHKTAAPYVMALCTLIALYPRNDLTVEKFLGQVSILSIAFTIAVPVLVFLIALLFKKQKVSV